MNTKLLELKAQIDALSPSQRLRLCADLIDTGQPEIAAKIAENVLLKMQLDATLKKLCQRELSVGVVEKR